MKQFKSFFTTAIQALYIFLQIGFRYINTCRQLFSFFQLKRFNLVFHVYHIFYCTFFIIPFQDITQLIIIHGI